MTEIPQSFITVKDDDDGQRFDRWLRKRVPTMPFGMVQRLIRKGAFRIDGKRAKGNAVLAAGQEVRIPAYRLGEARTDKNDTPKLSERDADYIRSLIIYDEGGILALNKPGDLAVQGGTGQKRYIDMMLPALADKDGVVPRLVHRLDKDTSGVLLLARSAKMAKALGAMFKGREVRKVYWSLVRRLPDPLEGTIRAPLAKAMGANNYERMVVDEEDGKFAETEYAVIDHAHNKAAFVAFWPRTGRTHQIRVHAELMRCPIIGDNKYSGAHFDEPLEPLDADGLGKGLHLHARQLKFVNPITRKKVDISAPLPPNLSKSWKMFGFSGKTKEDPFLDLEI